MPKVYTNSINFYYLFNEIVVVAVAGYDTIYICAIICVYINCWGLSFYSMSYYHDNNVNCI